jgi:3-hydroxyacyl-CoA dehydrogenase/enoyl-CoA hydratase/3-hydroxybutyryl-CoA epimerase
MNAPVTHSVDADGIGWITFDDPAARANVLNPATFAALAAAIGALEAAAVRAVVVRSAKERIFIAGADLKWLVRLPDAAAATAVSRDGQAVLQRLADFKVPVVCALHGAAAGGGFELALACHWRVASDAAVTQIGLPETGLGTIPGWGGCVRLPRLIGVQPALEHLLKGQLVPAGEALRAGLVDEVVPAAELTERVRAVALRLAAEGAPVRAVPAPPDAAWLNGLRQTTEAKARGQNPALGRVIEVVARGQTLALPAALAVEAEVFGAVMTGDICRNLIHAFFLRDGAKKRTLAGWFAGAPASPPPIRKVGVVGAGVMGSGIAQWCAARGLAVVLHDSQPAALDRARTVIDGLFAEAVKRGKMTESAAAEARARLTPAPGLAAFADCDLVIEAVIENVAAKQQLFGELAAVVRPDALLASNTSALPIEEIAGHVPNPARTLGIHFFNPVSRMPLVELILGRGTDAGAAGAALGFVKALGKSPVICRSSPGFLVTRVLFFYLNEACRLWEEGVPTGALDAAMRGWGWPMGPMRLIDEVGVDVTDFIFGEMAHYFPDRFRATTVCARLLAAGLKGRKNGASSGFYTYAERRETVNPAMNTILPPAHTRSHGPEQGDAAIVDRLMGVMVAEAQRCLDEGVIKTPDDVDFALLSGAGFPAFRGGLMRWARSGAVA